MGSFSFKYTINKPSNKKIVKAINVALGYISEADKQLTDNDYEAKFELEKISESAVQSFYDDYKPQFYKRVEDLYNAYRIDIDTYNHQRIIEFGSEFMKYEHHQENDLIYWIAFINGIHGGFPTQDFQGRVPMGVFSEFSSNPQPSSTPPIDVILKQVPDVFDKYLDKDMEIIDKLKADVQQVIKSVI